MPLSELIEYIQKAQIAGMHRQEIYESLINHGWQIKDIEEAFMDMSQLPIVGPAVSSNIIGAGVLEFGKKKPKKSWKILLGIFVLLIILVLSGIFGVPYFLSISRGADVVAPNMQGLQPFKIEMLSEANGFYDLQKLDQLEFIWPFEDFDLEYLKPNTKWDYDLADTAIEKNKILLDLFYSAADKEFFQDELYLDPENINSKVPPRSFSRWTQASRLAAIEAYQLSRRNHKAESYGKALKIIKLGKKIQEQQADIFEYLIGLNIENLGIEVLQQNSIYGTSPVELVTANKALIGLASSPEGLKSANKVEFAKFQAIVRDISFNGKLKNEIISSTAKYLPNNSFYFKPNMTLKYATDAATQDMADADLDCSLQAGQGPQNILPKKSARAFLRLFFTENLLGKILFDALNLDFSTVRETYCESQAKLSLLKTSLALAAYQLDKKVFPETLADLIPVYLESVPSDPFSAKDINYSKSEELIYSIGRDRKDNLGSVEKINNIPQDLVFKIHP